ncbi:hypothetical protein EVAR_44071_1 [Eumeta japonica]|uniref:Uncharacterized protein n=1 Tax=Eumeta variegata TaxID=151549 RepID=A0A4C1X4I2_EUMVA|nr:hypothetical protein EVAR_44071_1 [Eumeta japonica]
MASPEFPSNIYQQKNERPAGDGTSNVWKLPPSQPREQSTNCRRVATHHRADSGYVNRRFLARLRLRRKRSAVERPAAGARAAQTWPACQIGAGAFLARYPCLSEARL